MVVTSAHSCSSQLTSPIWPYSLSYEESAFCIFIIIILLFNKPLTNQRLYERHFPYFYFLSSVAKHSVHVDTMIISKSEETESSEKSSCSTEQICLTPRADNMRTQF